MNLRPITFREACAFVARLHRHNKPPRGHKFSIGLEHGGELVGVVMCGRPVARALDDGLTIEINRTCTDGTRNANSMFYGAAWRAAAAMGYVRAVTYTRQDETGASLRAAGWREVNRLAPRKDWAGSTKTPQLLALRERADLFADDRPTGEVPRILWERCDRPTVERKAEAA